MKREAVFSFAFLCFRLGCGRVSVPARLGVRQLTLGYRR